MNHVTNFHKAFYKNFISNPTDNKYTGYIASLNLAKTDETFFLDFLQRSVEFQIDHFYVEDQASFIKHFNIYKHNKFTCTRLDYGWESEGHFYESDLMIIVQSSNYASVIVKNPNRVDEVKALFDNVSTDILWQDELTNQLHFSSHNKISAFLLSIGNSEIYLSSNWMFTPIYKA